MNILWTPIALESFQDIAENIKRRFSTREEDNFLLETQHTINVISSYPKSFPKSNLKKLKGTRKALIHPHSTLFYRIINRKDIELLLFWDNRQDPQAIK